MRGSDFISGLLICNVKGLDFHQKTYKTSTSCIIEIGGVENIGFKIVLKGFHKKHH